METGTHTHKIKDKVKLKNKVFCRHTKLMSLSVSSFLSHGKAKMLCLIASILRVRPVLSIAVGNCFIHTVTQTVPTSALNQLFLLGKLWLCHFPFPFACIYPLLFSVKLRASYLSVVGICTQNTSYSLCIIRVLSDELNKDNDSRLGKANEEKHLLLNPIQKTTGN